MSAPTSQPKQPQTQSNPELKAQILTRLATALAAASARFQSAAAGQPTFTSDADLKASIALLKLAPALLQFLDPKPTTTAAAAAHKPSAIAPPRPSYVNLDPTNIPLIPKCTFCGQGPGAHWSDDCPDNPNSTGWNRHLIKRSTPNV